MTHSPKALREHSIALVAYAREVRAIAVAARLLSINPASGHAPPPRLSNVA
jgi:hypothetical protein